MLFSDRMTLIFFFNIIIVFLNCLFINIAIFINKLKNMNAYNSLWINLFIFSIFILLIKIVNFKFIEYIISFKIEKNFIKKNY